jgi:hypothetical protein
MSDTPFQGFKAVEVRRFSSTEFLRWVHDTTPIPPISKTKPPDANPVQRIFKILDRLKCKTILIEENYIDKDYKAEFSAFYAKRFCVPSPYCVRLQFFSKMASVVGKIKVPNQVEDLLLDDSAFLGYCIVRPTEYNRIGRTVIKYPTPTPAQNTRINYHVTCQASFKTHLFGHELKVFGAPFIQQETQVSSCAHASLWVVGRYMHMLNYCEEILPDKINDLAKARQPQGRYYPAEAGLVPSQMLDALHGMGLSAIHYGIFDINDAAKTEPVDNTAQLQAQRAAEGYEGILAEPQISPRTHFMARIVYPYVESGLPVILCLKKHVVVAIGHTLDIRANTGDTINRVPSFLINDDSVGPYEEFPLAPEPTSLYDPEDVTDIIAVLPTAAKLKGEYAEAAARAFTRLFDPELKIPLQLFGPKILEKS